MTRTEGRILVIRGGAIGDFILTLPVLAALRRQFPQTHLEVLGYAHIAQLALVGDLADAVRSIEARPLAGFFARHGSLAKELQSYFASFALIISYLYDPDGIFQANVARCTRGHFLAGPHRPDDHGPTHATEVFLKPLERLAIFDADPVPRLPLDNRLATADSGTACPRQLAVHPGSGSERKNWPEQKWTELLGLLAGATDWRFLMVGGEAEGDRLHRLAASLPPGRLEVARHLPLPELAMCLSRSTAFLGHDSGITHLAAAVDVPVCVLWGESVQTVWRPLGRDVRVLHEARGLAELSVPRVQEAVQQMLGQ